MQNMADLKQGYNSFKVVGKVKLGDNSLQDPKVSDSGWLGVRTSFGVDVDDAGNTVYINVNGGYNPSYDTIKKLPRERQETFAMVEIPLADRFNKEMIDKVQFNELFQVSGINKEDPSESKTFLLANDYLEYLQEHLNNGDEVVITGNVDYSWDFLGDDKPQYRNYNVSNLYMNPKNDKGEYKEKPMAEITQTYFVTADSLSDGWQNELKKEGKTVVSVKVPSYLGNARDPKTGKYTLAVKKNIAIPQSLVIQTSASKFAEADLINYVKGGLAIKGDDKVRAIVIQATINEGHESSTGNIKITPELQTLLDAGVIEMEELEKEVTVRGQRKSELVFNRYKYKKDDEGNIKADFSDDLYTFKDLVLPKVDSGEFEFPNNDDDNELPFTMGDDDSGEAINFDNLFA